MRGANWIVRLSGCLSPETWDALFVVGAVIVVVLVIIGVLT